ncbi:unnamed protein product [Diatraea saccharalis]|uniref:BZIP domain-containing protein n=1 Tax=Diatraea saccharalis TaxID=40085 RepID=A0A9N9WEB2_9NEOP|nr:unnamed protein product [Diatraea saccharalis]
MVFSQTSHKTQSILKVVDIDRLKANKEQLTNGQIGVIAGGNSELMPTPSTAAASFSEEFLKLEPAYDNAMFRESDCEFFQDLVQWCSDPVKDEPVRTIDSNKVIEERAHNNDILHTPFSPQGWETIDAKSPEASTGMYCSTPNDPLSPIMDEFGQYTKPLTPQVLADTNTLQFQEEFLDFNNMPVVFGDLVSEKPVDMNPVQNAGLVGWDHTHNMNTQFTNTQDTLPFEEDSKFVSVIPRELESNDVIITEVIFGPNMGMSKGQEVGTTRGEQRQGLTVNIPARGTGWPADLISTPDVVNCVEQLEKDNPPLLPLLTTNEWPAEDTDVIANEVVTNQSPPVDYEPITPKSESQAESENEERYTRRKRRYDSEVSDETYTPYQETTIRRKYTRRKPNVPIEDMIKELEGSQPLKKAKRGRPPKRRVSTVSSICSVDENSSSVSTHETNYRKLRDKNNEASKRSRMNRKLKELQMEQLALELEEKNKKLQIKADILEDMTKRLKDALMMAILQNK